MISALGAINGTVFTGSRMYATAGEEHRLFSWLGRWDVRSHSPLWALLAQALASLVMIAAVGTAAGHRLLDGPMTALGGEPFAWGDSYSGFSTLLIGTAPVFWVFFLLTGLALFVLRHKDRGALRPFALAVPYFPLVPLVFCG